MRGGGAGGRGGRTSPAALLLALLAGGVLGAAILSLAGPGSPGLRRENAELRARLGRAEQRLQAAAAAGVGSAGAGAGRQPPEEAPDEGEEDDPAEPDPGRGTPVCGSGSEEWVATRALREVAREYGDVIAGAPGAQHEGVVALAEGCRASQKCQRVIQGRGFTSAIDVGLVRRQLALLAALTPPLQALAAGVAPAPTTGKGGEVEASWGGGNPPPAAGKEPAAAEGEEGASGEEADGALGGAELRAAEAELVGHLGQCMRSHGQGLRLEPVGGRCGVNVTIPFGAGEANPHREAATYHFDACRLAEYWQQVRGLTTVLSKSFLASHPDPAGFASRYLNQQYKPGCAGRACHDLLRRRLPAAPPWRPAQFRTCAVVGNSADLKSGRMGPEIDRHEAVIRLNNAPTRGYEGHVGKTTTMRVTNHYYAAEHPGLERLPESGEAVVLRSHLGVGRRIFTRLSGGLGRPAGPGKVPLYFMHLPTYFENSAKASGVLAVMFAASVCEEVDVYGFTVDAGFTKWYRYFTAPRKGHAPKRGWAYYQLLECLGVVRLRSPKRAGSRRAGPDPARAREVVRRLHEARGGREPCAHYAAEGCTGAHGGGGGGAGAGACGGMLRYPLDADLERQLCVEVP